MVRDSVLFHHCLAMLSGSARFVRRFRYGKCGRVSREERYQRNWNKYLFIGWSSGNGNRIEFYQPKNMHLKRLFRSCYLAPVTASAEPSNKGKGKNAKAFSSRPALQAELFKAQVVSSTFKWRQVNSIRISSSNAPCILFSHHFFPAPKQIWYSILSVLATSLHNTQLAMAFSLPTFNIFNRINPLFFSLPAPASHNGTEFATIFAIFNSLRLVETLSFASRHLAHSKRAKWFENCSVEANRLRSGCIRPRSGRWSASLGSFLWTGIARRADTSFSSAQGREKSARRSRKVHHRSLRMQLKTASGERRTRKKDHSRTSSIEFHTFNWIRKRRAERTVRGEELRLPLMPFSVVCLNAFSNKSGTQFDTNNFHLVFCNWFRCGEMQENQHQSMQAIELICLGRGIEVQRSTTKNINRNMLVTLHFGFEKKSLSTKFERKTSDQVMLLIRFLLFEINCAPMNGIPLPPSLALSFSSR